MKLPLQTRRGSRRDERGYVLLALLLTMAMLVIFAAAIMPTIKFQIERDREEELIHRGTQYSRAIRGYYKKFGRYPVKIEDLESTNNMRFLRKRYKDPTNCAGGTCQDFKLLHFGEVRLMGAMMGIPGAQMVGSPGTTLPTAGTVGSPAQVSAFGGNNNYGANANSSAVAVPPAAQAAGSDSPPAGDDASKASGSSGSDNSSANSGGDTTGAAGGGTTGGTGGPGAGQVFGGGPIVGVVSTNKKDTIREFNHKKKYNEWQFIYDPGTDRGGLLMTPNQPPLTPFGQQPGQQNVNGQNGPTGLQNNPNSPGNAQPPATPNDPNNPPEQK
jgi:type II secretory pathway pseudopilin PulG